MKFAEYLKPSLNNSRSLDESDHDFEKKTINNSIKRMMEYVETDKDPVVQYLAHLYIVANSLLYLTHMGDEEDKDLSNIYSEYERDVLRAHKALKDFRKEYTETFGDF